MGENARIVEAHYAGSARGDLDAMLAPLADDIVWIEADGSPLAGTYVGPAAVADGVFAAVQRDWAEFRFEVDEVIDAGETVVAVGTYSGIHRGSGRGLRARVVQLWRVRDGRAVRFEQVADTALLAAAAR